jgi:uncharacterized protein (DUF302 family)
MVIVVSNRSTSRKETAMVPGIHKQVALDYEAVLAKLPEALKAEGFGVLTEVDVRGTLQTKLGVDFRRYKILGACNPTLAHQALQAEIGAGVMMPCNVIVYEDGDQTAVIAVDPMQTFAANEPGLRTIAEQVREKLQRVLERL